MSTSKQLKISNLNNIKEDYKYKISIIVPCYNTKLWLDECLQSLVDQTLQEIEIICVNDGSTDGTGERLDEWQAKYPDKIKVIHQQNGGVSNARNSGMAIAQGECIGFVDSDDFIDVCMYDKLYKVLTDNNADVVECGFLKFSNTDVFVRKQNKNNSLCIILVNPMQSFLNKRYFSWNSLFSKTFFKKNKIKFLSDICFLEDLAFTSDIIFNSPKIFRVLNIYYYYRTNRLNQLTSTKSKVLYDTIKVYHYIENKHIKYCHDEVVKKHLIRRKLCQYILLTLRINRNYKKDFLFKCANSIFNKNYKTMDIYKIILTTNYQKNINYLLGPASLILFNFCYLWQKLSLKNLKKYLTFNE